MNVDKQMCPKVMQVEIVDGISIISFMASDLVGTTREMHLTWLS